MRNKKGALSDACADRTTAGHIELYLSPAGNLLP